MSDPIFSIICPHYQPTINEKTFWRGMKCLQNQTFKSFEVLVYHDGPKVRDDKFPKDSRFSFKYTEERANDWGHSNRDLGIREAKGIYIVHFNPDNVLYPNALEEINRSRFDNVPYLNNDNIIIFPIWMMGMVTNGQVMGRITKPPIRKMLFTGFPTVRYNIDAMQLVMKREKWLEYGGWYDKSEQSDGFMYPKFVEENGARYLNEVLGEHW